MARLDTDVTLGQRYRLVRPLSSGGMGSVWEAEDAVLHRRVAVKVLSDGLSADQRFVERFVREARAAAGLSHPNVAGVFDYGEDGGSRFIVMELIDGETLADRLTHGAIEPEEAVRIAVGVAEGLQAAHDAGLVHRDVKPANVMLARSGDVKVMDFGIASAAWATSLTATGHTLGTATYLSPEQAQGERATPRSDVYSLGVVLYEMLTGRPPFTGDSPVALAASHAQAPPPPIEETGHHVPEHVTAACQRALAKDPAERPSSAAAFAAMLRSPSTTEELPDHGTSVLPATGGEPYAALAARWVSRWRRVLIPVGVMIGLLLLTVVLAIAFRGDRGETGRPRVDVPAVIGLPTQDAGAALRGAGLEVGDVQFVEGEPGVVVDSDPPPGSSVRPGTSVTLFVGEAPPPQEEEGDESGRGKGKKKGGGGGGDD